VITAFFEHLASAEAIAGVSSAVPFEVRYCDGTTHVWFLGARSGEVPATKSVARTKIDNMKVVVIILKAWNAIRNYRITL
jgi:hypothetical protein